MKSSALKLSFYFLFVLGFGLISCTEESAKSKPNATTPGEQWSGVDIPLLVSGSESHPVTLFASDVTRTMQTTDFLRFSERNSQEPIQLAIQSICLVNGEVKLEKSLNLPMTRDIKVLSLLPDEIFYDPMVPDQSRLNCDFVFLAQHSTHGKHRFFIRNTQVHHNPNQINLKFRRFGNDLSPRESQALVQADFATTLIQLFPVSESHVRLQCQSFHSEVTYYPPRLVMDQFQFPKDAIGDHRIQNCRILQTDSKTQQLIGLSQYFAVKFTSLPPLVTTQWTAIDHSNAKNARAFQTTITNPSADPMWLLFRAHPNQHIPIRLYIPQAYIGTWLVHDMTVPVHSHLNAQRHRKETSQGAVFSLNPGESATIDHRLNLDIHCTRPNTMGTLVHSIHLSTNPAQLMNLQQINPPADGVAIKNIHSVPLSNHVAQMSAKSNRPHKPYENTTTGKVICRFRR